MRILSNIPETDPVDANYPKGRIRNKDTAALPPKAGTPVVEEVYGDMIQLFQNLVDLAGILENNLPDNTTNGYQLKQALEFFIKSFVASTTELGLVEKATTAEAQAGTAGKFLDAALLQTVTATVTRKGIVEKATTAEAQGGAAEKYLDAALLQLVTALETRKGVAALATTSEMYAGTNDTKIITPLKLKTSQIGQLQNVFPTFINVVAGVITTADIYDYFGLKKLQFGGEITMSNAIIAQDTTIMNYSVTAFTPPEDIYGEMFLNTAAGSGYNPVPIKYTKARAIVVLQDTPIITTLNNFKINLIF